MHKKSPLDAAATPEIYPARLAKLEQVEHRIRSLARHYDVSETEVLRLMVVVEELFTNTVEHGYGGECDEPIEITV